MKTLKQLSNTKIWNNYACYPGAMLSSLYCSNLTICAVDMSIMFFFSRKFLLYVCTYIGIKLF